MQRRPGRHVGRVCFKASLCPCAPGSKPLAGLVTPVFAYALCPMCHQFLSLFEAFPFRVHTCSSFLTVKSLNKTLPFLPSYLCHINRVYSAYDQASNSMIQSRCLHTLSSTFSPRISCKPFTQVFHHFLPFSNAGSPKYHPHDFLAKHS